jgi:hypothetical protein
MSHRETKDRYVVWFVHNPSRGPAGRDKRELSSPRRFPKAISLQRAKRVAHKFGESIYPSTLKKFILYSPKKRRAYVVMPHLDWNDKLTLETQATETLDGPADVRNFAAEWIIND